MGEPRPQAPPQVQRDAGRPTQRQQGLLLLPHGLADGQETPCRHEGRQDHNYHHTFPYDYGTSEWGFRLNVTTRFINTMAKLGFAYDLRTASPSVVAARAARTGHPELTRQGMAAKKLS